MEHVTENLVPFHCILSAVNTLHGPQSTIVDYQVNHATSSLQGFLSLILRVQTQVRLENGHMINSSLIVKRLPIMKEQLEIIQDSDFFERETNFFKIALPLMLDKNPNLPIVNCLAAYDSMLILEDLCVSGYRTASLTMKTVGSNLELHHFRYAVRKLAEFHAASLDIDWLKLMPILKKEAFFESKHGRKIMESSFTYGGQAIVEILKEIRPDLDKKYSEWLLSPQCFEKATSYVKPSDKYLNVLNHGDFWENNMMFKFNADLSKITGIKFIDLQLVRYAPASIDLYYFIFVGSDKKFREENEDFIVETYVTAFNTAVCETPDRLTVEMFKKEWQECRLFGALLSAMIKPMVLMDDVFPHDSVEMSKEQLEEVLYGVKPEKVVHAFHNSAKFNDSMRDIIDELIQEMEKSDIFINE